MSPPILFPANLQLLIKRTRHRGDNASVAEQETQPFHALTNPWSDKVRTNRRYSSGLNSRNAIGLDICCSLSGEESEETKRSTQN